jgi:hypothetical protein
MKRPQQSLEEILRERLKAQTAEIALLKEQITALDRHVEGVVNLVTALVVKLNAQAAG